MFLTREAGVSIKPGVKRSATPGTVVENIQSPRSGRQPIQNRKSIAKRSRTRVALMIVLDYRPLRGLIIYLGLGTWGLRPRLYAAVRSAHCPGEESQA